MGVLDIVKAGVVSGDELNKVYDYAKARIIKTVFNTGNVALRNSQFLAQVRLSHACLISFFGYSFTDFLSIRHILKFM